MSDTRNEGSVHPDELGLLKNIATAASDYLLAQTDGEFARLNGGSIQLRKFLVEAKDAYEEFLSEDQDCRNIV